VKLTYLVVFGKLVIFSHAVSADMLALVSKMPRIKEVAARNR
jgi:hypothetical protein